MKKIAFLLIEKTRKEIESESDFWLFILGNFEFHSHIKKIENCTIETFKVFIRKEKPSQKVQKRKEKKIFM